MKSPSGQMLNVQSRLNGSTGSSCRVAGGGSVKAVEGETQRDEPLKEAQVSQVVNRCAPTGPQVTGSCVLS